MNHCLSLNHDGICTESSFSQSLTSPIVSIRALMTSLVTSCWRVSNSPQLPQTWPGLPSETHAKLETGCCVWVFVANVSSQMIRFHRPTLIVV